VLHLENLSISSAAATLVAVVNALLLAEDCACR